MEIGFKNDDIFLMSKEEYYKYEKYINVSHNGVYWLRDGIGTNGIVNTLWCKCNEGVYVGTACCLTSEIGVLALMKMDSTNYKVGDKKSFADTILTLVDDNLWVTTYPIAYMKYRDGKVTDCTYENSDVRKYLLEWRYSRIYAM